MKDVMRIVKLQMSAFNKKTVKEGACLKLFFILSRQLYTLF